VEYENFSKTVSHQPQGSSEFSGRCPAHTAERVRRPEQRTIQFLTQDELRRLFKVIRSKRDKAIFLVAYRHGLRASEIGLLQRTDVGCKAGEGFYSPVEGSISGVYPMQPDVLKVIRSYLRARADESPYLFLSWRSRSPATREAQVPLFEAFDCNASPGCWRLTWLLLKDWLGHANIQNTTIYARLTTATLDAQARTIFASHRVV